MCVCWFVSSLSLSLSLSCLCLSVFLSHSGCMRADNAYDPDVSADVLKIQKEDKHGKRCLVFHDNGYGMDLDHLIKMLRYRLVGGQLPRSSSTRITRKRNPRLLVPC
eukprot:TRINITY_DN15643_c0_g1_i5.p1 TRINITY_DN15643_c0_g1~~TRINITY_DN15643_c0_g1_i5.p1  ORF type:complete len:107 (+),score=22.37 TRINITY_DN15643_c0_g1_i5:121-441(+)